MVIYAVSRAGVDPGLEVFYRLVTLLPKIGYHRQEEHSAFRLGDQTGVWCRCLNLQRRPQSVQANFRSKNIRR